MLFRVRDILPVIAPNLRGTGVDITGDPNALQDALDAYNRINEILMNRENFPGTLATVRFPAHSGTITLPERFESLKQIDIDGKPSSIFPVGWQFLESGPGERHHLPHYDMRHLNHLGSHFPTSRDLPCAMPVFAFSDCEESAGTRILVTGYDELNRPLRISLPIAKASPTRGPRLSKVFSSITVVSKTWTNGNIDLGGWSDTDGPYWLSRMEPRDQSPCFTRYQLPHLPAHGQLPVGQCHCISALVTLRFRDLYDLDDVSLIQHREAYRMASQAITGLDANDGGIGSQFMNRAMKLLTDSVGRLESGQRQAINVSVKRTLTKRYHNNRRFR